MKNNKELQKIYGEWLNKYDWTYFVTLTSNSQISLKQANEYINQLYNQLSKGNEVINLFWVAEPHIAHGYHLHALIKTPHSYTYKSILKCEWQKIVKSK